MTAAESSAPSRLQLEAQGLAAVDVTTSIDT